MSLLREFGDLIIEFLELRQIWSGSLCSEKGCVKKWHLMAVHMGKRSFHF